MVQSAEVERRESGPALRSGDAAQQEILETHQSCCIAERHSTARGEVIETVQLVVATLASETELVTSPTPRDVVAENECIERAAPVVVNAWSMEKDRSIERRLSLTRR